ncbi:ABC transporter permease [Allorhizocola rhizosphaerae]|uniref:ABC transporter permease n=1 Tax=Allorhizocola rhizosphaerae TaxID=1872709 RepID=UPI000E3B932E|nr:ABC-2 family transporter protein [Allorhizocola rhizosphaerae]
MGDTLRIYAKLIAAQGRSQASYRFSFWLDLGSNVIIVGADLLAVLVIFSRVPVLAGFSVTETVLLFGLSLNAFSLADLFVGNIERIRFYVRFGTLDTVLIRPLGVLPQLLALDVGFRRIGRIIYSLAVLTVALVLADIDWTPWRVVLLIATPLFGAMFFCAFFIATSTVAFWWIESGELANALTYGGRDFTSYPITVYGNWFRRIFAFGLGFAFVAYYPGLALLGRADPLGGPMWLGLVSPVVALAAGGVAAAFWRFGVRHYRSTGS